MLLGALAVASLAVAQAGAADTLDFGEASRQLTPDTAIDCAVWSLIKMDGATREDEEVFALTFQFLIGFYEGQTGAPYEERLTERLNNADDAWMVGVEPRCVNVMGDLGTRLEDWAGGL